MNADRVGLLAVALLAACGTSPAEEASEGRLDGPCTIEDPGSSSPMGLAEPGKSQKYAVWPDGRIPYVIDTTLDGASETAVLAAMNDWETKSQRFIHRPITIRTELGSVDSVPERLQLLRF